MRNFKTEDRKYKYKSRVCPFEVRSTNSLIKSHPLTSQFNESFLVNSLKCHYLTLHTHSRIRNSKAFSIVTRPVVVRTYTIIRK
ncbi:hypothetical protein L596_014881 [Steinernema carpocapsae]|uniref:Uncharacterized protein n=1 Tax=Steinernema carpocapsae TaxID=34508 RepID=A0A4U5ND62_STECR|nr:hypothetical protein L596_014881 [Steinernema carpocapsae]